MHAEEFLNLWLSSSLGRWRKYASRFTEFEIWKLFMSMWKLNSGPHKRDLFVSHHPLNLYLYEMKCKGEHKKK